MKLAILGILLLSVMNMAQADERERLAVSQMSAEGGFIYLLLKGAEAISNASESNRRRREETRVVDHSRDEAPESYYNEEEQTCGTSYYDQENQVCIDPAASGA